MTVGILGSGFGLYGYLPAAIETLRRDVVLLERYRSKLFARPELAPYSRFVTWIDSESALLAHATLVIVARRPQDQIGLVSAAMARDNILALVLEKPLAPSPSAAEALLEGLTTWPGRVVVSYTLAETEWAAALVRELQNRVGVETHIRWRFLAHHFANPIETWKRRQEAGGGALRFYGVQLLAVLALLQPLAAVESHLEYNTVGEVTGWSAMIDLAQSSRVCIEVETLSPQSSFRVLVTASGEHRTLFDGESPFHEVSSAPPSGQDRRVPYLSRILQRLRAGHAQPEYYARVNALWRRCEELAERPLAESK